MKTTQTANVEFTKEERNAINTVRWIASHLNDLVEAGYVTRGFYKEDFETVACVLEDLETHIDNNFGSLEFFKVNH